MLKPKTLLIFILAISLSFTSAFRVNATSVPYYENLEEHVLNLDINSNDFSIVENSEILDEPEESEETSILEIIITLILFVILIIIIIVIITALLGDDTAEPET